MSTIKVFSRPFLIPFVVELVEANLIGQEDTSILFECLAEDFDHAVEQALNAYPDAELLEVIDEF